jgi:hypothetical protein
VVSFFGVFLLPLGVGIGYGVRVLTATVNDDDELPAFDRWEELLVEGFEAFVIALVSGPVPLVAGGAVVITAGLESVVTDRGTVGLVTLPFGSLVRLVVGLLLAAVVPAALANFAERGSLADGFGLGYVYDVVTTGTYFAGAVGRRSLAGRRPAAQRPTRPAVRRVDGRAGQGRPR